MGKQCFLFLYQFLHLGQEPMLDLGDIVEFFHGCALAQGLIHHKVALAGGRMEPTKQFLLAERIKILGMAQTVAAGFQAADGLLECLLIGLADTHDLAHGTHLGAQLVLHALEFFKGPPGKLNDHIVTVGCILVQSTVLAAGNIL